MENKLVSLTNLLAVLYRHENGTNRKLITTVETKIAEIIKEDLDELLLVDLKDLPSADKFGIEHWLRYVREHIPRLSEKSDGGISFLSTSEYLNLLRELYEYQIKQEIKLTEKDDKIKELAEKFANEVKEFYENLNRLGKESLKELTNDRQEQKDSGNRE